MQTEKILFIKSELEPQNVREACSACMGRVSEASPLSIELDGPEANIFALQLAIACKRSLESQGNFLGFGPIAQREVGQRLKDNTSDPDTTMKEPA